MRHGGFRAQGGPYMEDRDIVEKVSNDMISIER